MLICMYVCIYIYISFAGRGRLGAQRHELRRRLLASAGLLCICVCVYIYIYLFIYP